MPARFNPVILQRPVWRWAIYALVAAYAIVKLAPLAHSFGRNNGFDLADSLIPRRAIESGGPPRDGIPAIDHPEFLPAGKADFLRADDRILGLSHGGVVKAYPIRILNYHEIVNDVAGADPVLISFCPLCGTGMAFSARVGGKTLRFGVSGLLYNSDVLLYDHATESLWSQLMSEAVTGPMRGKKLRQISLLHTTWSAWRKAHPDTLVLSRDTGSSRDYSRSPYQGYADSDAVWFDVAHRDVRYRAKELVMGVVINGVARAYPFLELARTGKHTIADTLAGAKLQIKFDAVNRSSEIRDSQGQVVPSTIGFWFAWVAFHPDTLVFVADPAARPTGPAR